MLIIIIYILMVWYYNTSIHPYITKQKRNEKKKIFFFSAPSIYTPIVMMKNFISFFKKILYFDLFSRFDMYVIYINISINVENRIKYQIDQWTNSIAHTHTYKEMNKYNFFCLVLSCRLSFVVVVEKKKMKWNFF